MQDLVIDLLEIATGEDMESELPDPPGGLPRDNIDVIVQGIADRAYDEISGPGGNKEQFTNTIVLLAFEGNNETFAYAFISDNWPIAQAYIDDTGSGDWRRAGDDIQIKPISTSQIRVSNTTGSSIAIGRVTLTVVSD